MSILTIFYILAAVTLATGFMTVISKNPIHSAIYLVLCFFSVAGHYLMFNAQFLSLVHVIVYAGAIMVLILFTIMLMNLNKENEPNKNMLSKISAAIAFGLLSFVMLATFIKTIPIIDTYKKSDQNFQSIKLLGKVLLK